MARLSWFATSRARTARFSESVDAKLTETVFSQSGVLIIGALMPAAVAILAFQRTGQHWFIWWGVSSAVVLAYRVALDAAFRRRRVRDGRLTVWRKRFIFGAWANGANCGLGAGAIVFRCDASTQLLVAAMAMAFVMGSAARNGTLPEAAVGSILLAQIPVVVACLVTRDPFYAWFAMFVVLFTVAAGSVAKHVYLQTVGLLVAGEETAALVGEVGRSNRELGFANERFERANLQLAATNAAFAAANTQLELANAQLAALARTDALTGLPNRRAFDEYVEKETRAALREGACLSLLILDIDFFKNFNDHYGHQRGDECLQLIARTLASCARRPRELVARYGGEEFVAILPQTDSAGAAALAETMRVAVAGLKLEQAPSVGGIVTVSIGVTTWRPGTFEDAAAMLRRVDRALYDAKDSGRNCICVAAEAPMSTDGSETAE